MAALYPGELRVWTTKFDYTTIVFADHFNTTQDELTALLRTVGLTPQIARNDPGSTPASLRPIVDWLSRSPSADLDHALDLIENSDGKTFAALLSEINILWPDWGGES
ncbi:hypothetical protein [Nonomuraea typhae]|uniref:Uncharacterized protein n=1 Tax=Nonomuraea typhae TaxID=2603600 RepID=A0ABW7YJL6_9ACTN